MTAAVNRLKKTKKTGSRRRAHSRAHRRALPSPILEPPHLVGSAAGVSSSPDPPPDLRRRRRLGPSCHGSMPPPCGSTSREQGVDAAGLDPRIHPGSAVVWIHVAGSRRGRLDPPPCARPCATQHLAYERERDEGGLRGERGWERERERHTGRPGSTADAAARASPSAPRRRPASPHLADRRRARLAEPSAARERRGGGASPGREERREEGRREECRAGEREWCGAREEG